MAKKMDSVFNKYIELIGEGTTLEEKNKNILMRAIEYELEQIDELIRNYEIKYGIDFKIFVKSTKEQLGIDPFSYEAETDFFEWEGLLSRKKKLLSLLKELRGFNEAY